MFRKPLVWIVFVVVAGFCAVYCLTYFPRAFPLVNLDLRMDRDAAMEEAGRLAEEHGWGPEGFRQAAAFEVDGEVRSFVELEAGGRKAYIEMIGGELYSPYTWNVRLFLPGEAGETQVRFTPAGEFFGFYEVLPEEDPGAALTAEEARAIAESAATGTWGSTWMRTNWWSPGRRFARAGASTTRWCTSGRTCGWERAATVCA